MLDESPESPKTFQYPLSYRLMAALGVSAFGVIALISAKAAWNAIKLDPSAVALYLISLIISILLMLWGLDFATRSITAAPEGLRVRWLLRRSVVQWPDVLGWRYRALDVIHIRFRRGPGVWVWPLLEHYLDLLTEIDAHRRDQLAS
jgi:hypothetical protein